MFFNTEHLKASNQKLHNDHSLERILQRNAFTGTGFIFTVTGVLHCLPASLILLPMTITKGNSQPYLSDSSVLQESGCYL